MAQTNIEGAATTHHMDRDRESHDSPVAGRHPTETRRAFKTTEFFVMFMSVAAVIVVGYADNDSLNAARVWTLIAVLASAYMVSRGLAKAGSSECEQHRADHQPAGPSRVRHP